MFGVVIAEGFQLLHHERVRDLIGPMPTYLLELSKEECIRRRAQPVHASLNPHPISESHMVAVVWPAYEAYHTQSVAPLFAEGRVVCMPSPETDEDVETIVERICADMGAATSTCTALHISAAERPQIVTAVVARNDSTGGTLLRKVPTHSRSGDVYLECRTVCYDGEVISILPHAGGSAHAAEAADFAWVRTAMGVEGYIKREYLTLLASTPHAASDAVVPPLVSSTGVEAKFHSGVAQAAMEMGAGGPRTVEGILDGVEVQIGGSGTQIHIGVVTMMGSFCPVTLGHIQCFVEARKLLLAGTSPAGQHHIVVGYLRLNGDSHLQHKFSGSGDVPLAYSDRKMLINLATQDMPWLETSDYSSRHDVEALRRRYGHWAVFHHFEMNGADDVCKCVSFLLWLS